MRNSKVVSITMPKEMLSEAAQLARKEKRTMSELLREAFRRYQREQEWNDINAFGRVKARGLGITEDDVVRIIHEHRKDQRNASQQRPSKSGS